MRKLKNFKTKNQKFEYTPKIQFLVTLNISN